MGSYNAYLKITLHSYDYLIKITSIFAYDRNTIYYANTSSLKGIKFLDLVDLKGHSLPLQDIDDKPLKVE